MSNIPFNSFNLQYPHLHMKARAKHLLQFMLATRVISALQIKHTLNSNYLLINNTHSECFSMF